ncbi:MAG: hypothetical protein ACREIF_09485 [Chthoniobacterales bacterium]
MKKTLLILACAAAAPLALAQTVTTDTTKTTRTDPTTGTTETTTTITTTHREGMVTTFEPGKVIVVREEGVTGPVSYVLGKTVRYVNSAGEAIEANMIHPGARVHVYYDRDGDTQVVTRVMVDPN